MFFEDLSTIRVSTVLLFCSTCLASFAISYFQQSLELYAAFYRSGKLFKTFSLLSSRPLSEDLLYQNFKARHQRSLRFYTAFSTPVNSRENYLLLPRRYRLHRTDAAATINTLAGEPPVTQLVATQGGWQEHAPREVPQKQW
jgi:hypothetical protein